MPTNPTHTTNPTHSTNSTHATSSTHSTSPARPANSTNIISQSLNLANAGHVQKLLYTTHNDLSLDSFIQAGWTVRFYDEPIVPCSADLVYFRDPFNDPEYQPDPFHIDQLISQHQDAQIVDHISSFQDILELEDKYLQATTYQELYPATWLPSQREFVPGSHLAKPRISQRAKNILFDLEDRTLDDSWIIQELLDIQEELRVYVVCGDILDQASIKSSKSSGKVKIIGDRPLTPEEIIFIHQVMEKCPLDFVGFDIAVLPDHQYKVIEANRSPQFLRYSERTGLNLAAIINKHYQP